MFPPTDLGDSELNIHEYQGKELLAQYGVPTPPGAVAASPSEARAVAERLGGRVVVKAQVHVGGRGKAGGIKLADDPEAAESVARTMLGSDLKGLTVHKVLVEKAVDIAGEIYLGITLDRAARRSVVMLSTMGGVDIEDVAHSHPDKITRVSIDPALGLRDFQIRRLIYESGVDVSLAGEAMKFVRALDRCYHDIDATLAEINPLAVTNDGQLLAADAKINIDDNALFRHPELLAFKEESETDALEAEAHRRGLQYVHLGGEVGIIGNGAGLVMATLDEVKRAGANPANFLDIGGGAKADVVANALEMVLSDPAVKGVLFNIFGGITRGDEVARGILGAAARLNISVPIVVRLTGTNEEEGRALLRGSTLIPAATMQEGAERIAGLIR